MYTSINPPFYLVLLSKPGGYLKETHLSRTSGLHIHTCTGIYTNKHILHKHIQNHTMKSEESDIILTYVKSLLKKFDSEAILNFNLEC